MDWQLGYGPPGSQSVLLIAEEPDGYTDFLAQIEEIGEHLDWADSELLDMAEYPDITEARQAMIDSLAGGRGLMVFSGHSSPTSWALRTLLNSDTVPDLGNSGKPTMMVTLACQTTYDVSPNANLLGHQLLYGGDVGRQP